MRSARRVVLFVVEGISDKIVFEAVLNSILKDDFHKFAVVEGDLTSNTSKTTVDNVEERILEYVNKRLKKKEFLLSDIECIIQVTDTDGAYIPDSKIIEHKNSPILYSDNNIRTENVEKLKDRNKLKSSVINKLQSLNEIELEKGLVVPYKLYFMSCNLDHVVHGDRCLSDRQKKNKAEDYTIDIMGEEEKFIELLESDLVTHYKTYEDSWTEIQKGCNSLRRASNFNLYFKEKSE